jgi:hypothetical protein
MQFYSFLEFFYCVLCIFQNPLQSGVCVLFFCVCTICSDDAFGAAYMFSAKLLCQPIFFGDITVVRKRNLVSL